MRARKPVTEHLEQGTFEWWRARFGMITMSVRVNTLMQGSVFQLNDLLKKIRWEKSVKHDDKLLLAQFEKEQQLAERVEALAWGRKCEPEAQAHYEMTRGVDLIRPGFVVHERWPDLIGDSTDFIEVVLDTESQVVDRYPVELKCYLDSSKHLHAIRHGMSMDHYNQVQGHLECWGASIGKFFSFDPRAKVTEKQIYIQVVERDELWHERFVSRAKEFAHHLQHGTNFDFDGAGGVQIPTLFS